MITLLACLLTATTLQSVAEIVPSLDARLFQSQPSFVPVSQSHTPIDSCVDGAQGCDIEMLVTGFDCHRVPCYCCCVLANFPDSALDAVLICGSFVSKQKSGFTPTLVSLYSDMERPLFSGVAHLLHPQPLPNVALAQALHHNPSCILLSPDRSHVGVVTLY